MSDATSLLLVSITAVLNACGLVAIKRGLLRCGPFPLAPPLAMVRYAVRFLSRPDGLIGTAAFVIAPVAFVASLRSTELMVAYPTFMGLSFVLTMLLAAVFLGERVPLRGVGGAFLILAGIFLLQLNGG